MYNNNAVKEVDCMNNDCEDLIKVKDVSVWYGQSKALDNVSINLKRNKITAFIGPSGCGKTTLLRCFNRMNDLIGSFKLSGTITVDNVDVYNNKQDVVDIRRRIGMVFQQPNPFPKSIYDNLKLPIKENFAGKKSKEIDSIIVEKLKDTGLYDEVKDRLKKSALKLSGGQQQRLCIARALTIEPKIILLDEPCSALDPISTMKIESMLTELKDKYTIVIVTHNMEQATRIADNVAFFYQGRIEEQGTSEDIFINAKSKLTQDYIRGRF